MNFKTSLSLFNILFWNWCFFCHFIFITNETNHQKQLQLHFYNANYQYNNASHFQTQLCINYLYQSFFYYQAGIVVTLTTGWTSVCGGSLVSNTRVLTAAHCWWDGQSQASQFTVVLGSLLLFSGGNRIVTKDIVLHPNWNTNDIRNDIAVVKIPSVQYTS